MYIGIEWDFDDPWYTDALTALILGIWTLLAAECSYTFGGATPATTALVIGGGSLVIISIVLYAAWLFCHWATD